ncbi:hypothetical protein KAI68_06890, partial [bacterium]|nr:hypothetical protein [bacterium]
MLKLFSKNRNIKEDQQLLFFYLEKIVNITLAKTERGDNQSVKEILKDLEYIFRKFWQLKKDNPDKFEAFLWSKDFLENYVQPIERGKSLIKEDSKEAKSAEELKQEAALLLSFSAETKVKGLTQFLESFKKIWECSFRCDNDEISRCVIDHLNWLLAELTREPLNNLFVEQFLKLLHSITWKAIKSSEKEMNASVFAASIYWYIDIVFNRLRQREKSFDLCYLELFNDYFFSSVRCIISRNQTSLFNNLVSSLVDRVTVTLYYSGKIWDYDFLIRQSGMEKYQKLNEEYRIGDRIERLDSEKDLHTREKLNKWIEKFDELKQILEPNFNKEQKKKA